MFANDKQKSARELLDASKSLYVKTENVRVSQQRFDLGGFKPQAPSKIPLQKSTSAYACGTSNYSNAAKTPPPVPPKSPKVLLAYARSLSPPKPIAMAENLPLSERLRLTLRSPNMDHKSILKTLPPIDTVREETPEKIPKKSLHKSVPDLSQRAEQPEGFEAKLINVRRSESVRRSDGDATLIVVADGLQKSLPNLCKGDFSLRQSHTTKPSFNDGGDSDTDVEIDSTDAEHMNTEFEYSAASPLPQALSKSASANHCLLSDSNVSSVSQNRNNKNLILNEFFDTLGMNRVTFLQLVAASNQDDCDSNQFFSSISSTATKESSSIDDSIGPSPVRNAVPNASGQCDFQNPVNIIERHARVLKWMSNCHKEQSY